MAAAARQRGASLEVRASYCILYTAESDLLCCALLLLEIQHSSKQHAAEQAV